MKVYLYILLAVALSSCKTTLKGSDLIKWVENEKHGLRQIKKFQNIEFQLQYQPIDYLVALESKKDLIKTEEYNKIRKEKDSAYYFSLRIITLGKDIVEAVSKSQADYPKVVQYLSFDMQNDFNLINGEDSLPCILYHFERSYNIYPYSTVLMAFPGETITDNDFKLIYEDKIFNIGTVKFKIDKMSLNNIPNLKTE